MIELLSPECYNEEIVNRLRIMSNTLGLGWSISPFEHYILDLPWIITKLPKPDKNINILDAGCGTGALQFWCSDKYNTFSIDRLKYFEQIHSRHNNIQYIQCDLCATPFRDKFFDYIVSCSAFEHNAPDRIPGIMDEMKRILKPNGIAVFTVLFRRESVYHDSDWYSFNDSMLNDLFVRPGLELYNNFNNTDQFNDIYFNKFLPYFKEQPYPYIPVGMVLIKK